MSPSWLCMSWHISQSRDTGLLCRTCRLNSRDSKPLVREMSSERENRVKEGLVTKLSSSVNTVIVALKPYSLYSP